MIRKLFLLILCHAVAVNILCAQQKKSALFIGNSYVAVNNLPQTTAFVALSIGDTLLSSAYTPGGYTFQQHSTDISCINAINSMPWDFVALQEQSQRPSFPQAQVEQEVFPFAKALDSLIHLNNPCTKTLFYMTWGRKNGDASNCAAWPPICSYTGMDDLLRQRYEFMADTNHAACAPVGAVWRYIRTHYLSVNLYQADESHPTLEGTFAAACTFNTLIFHRDPMLISYNNGIATNIADSIKMAVKAVAFDSLWYWERNQRVTKAGFIPTISGTNVQFQNTSTFASSYQWSFGDNTSDTVNSPSHTYPTPGTYSVTLIATGCGLNDTITSAIQIVSDSSTSSNLSLIANTRLNSFWRNNQLHLNSSNLAVDFTISLYNLNGQLQESSSWNPAKGEWVSRTYPLQQLMYIKLESQNCNVTLKTLSSE